MMTKTYASSITTCRSAHAEKIEAPAARVYRIRKSFAAVHFEHTGKGRIVFLPRGAKLSVVGSSSCLREGFEVMYERQLYNIFKADLWGALVQPNGVESNRAQSMQDEARYSHGGSLWLTKCLS
jgi:hypothetical protein